MKHSFVGICSPNDYFRRIIVSERTEPFYNLTLEVKDNANVRRVFKNGSRRDFARRKLILRRCVTEKSRAIKRLRIKRLPRAILQLKRFELNYDTFEKVKLNDKYVQIF